MTAAKAELIPDRGAAASDDQFFRSRSFLEAEGTTHTLRIESESTQLLAPLKVREIPGTAERDAVSPYGFPGLAIRGSALDPKEVDFSATGLVSVFIRHALGPSPLTDAS